MRNILYHNRERFGKQSRNGIWTIFVNCWFSTIGYILENKIKMIESKTFYLILTVIGVPAFIYTYFIKFADIVTTRDWVKTATLSIIIICVGLFFLIRSFIKTLYAVWELMDKYKKRNKKEQK